jgi:hypothetical protein
MALFLNNTFGLEDNQMIWAALEKTWLKSGVLDVGMMLGQ